MINDISYVVIFIDHKLLSWVSVEWNFDHHYRIFFLNKSHFFNRFFNLRLLLSLNQFRLNRLRLSLFSSDFWLFFVIAYLYFGRFFNEILIWLEFDGIWFARAIWLLLKHSLLVESHAKRSSSSKFGIRLRLILKRFFRHCSLKVLL